VAVTFMTGFEAQAASADGITSLNGTAAYSTAQARTGVASIRCNPASGVTGYINASTATGWYHAAVYIATMPSVARYILGTNIREAVRLNTDGTLSYKDGNGAIVGTSATALTTNAWYWVGWRGPIGTTVPCLQINGVTEVTGSPAGATATAFFAGCLGTEASGIDIYIDDIIVDGAGFLAPSKVDIALPISDNTRTAVTAGAGGTTDLWDAVNNTPPAGLASASETNTSNIEYPASATESYIANLETYTTLGVASGDTVLAVQSVIRHGEDIATGTKNGVLGAVTNPTISDSLSFVFGTDGGAHGADSGGALWVTKFGTLTTSPSVTVGTSPTLAVTRVSEIRVGCVDFMGLLVAWTPGTAATRVPYYQPYPQLLAQ